MISNVFSSSMFRYDPKTREFFQEASTLSQGHGSPFGRIYPDACDLGLTIVSANTGVHATYYLTQEGTDCKVDNEVVRWVLLPTPETCRDVPGACGTRVIIWND